MPGHTPTRPFTPYTPRVLSTVFNGMVRYRRWTLIAAVDVAVACVALQIWLGPGEVLPLLLSFLSMGMFVLAMDATTLPAPSGFAVVPRTPAFRTRPDVTQICLLIGLIFLTTSQVASLVSRHLAEPGSLPERQAATVSDVVVYATILGVGLWSAAVWRGRLGPELRPEGLMDRRPLGTLVVPWDALTVGHPPEPAASAGRWLTLSYARPELVRRHGLCGDPRALRLGDGAVNAGFLGQVIDFYVANPDRRERIGTDAEYDDLCLRLGVVGARR